MRAAKNKNATVKRLFIPVDCNLPCRAAKTSLWGLGSGTSTYARPRYSQTLLSHLERQFRGVCRGIARNREVHHVSAGCETGGLQIEDVSACRPKSSIKAEVVIWVGIAGVIYDKAVIV